MITSEHDKRIIFGSGVAIKELGLSFESIDKLREWAAANPAQIPLGGGTIRHSTKHTIVEVCEGRIRQDMEDYAREWLPNFDAEVDCVGWTELLQAVRKFNEANDHFSRWLIQPHQVIALDPPLGGGPSIHQLRHDAIISGTVGGLSAKTKTADVTPKNDPGNRNEYEWVFETESGKYGASFVHETSSIEVAYAEFVAWAWRRINSAELELLITTHPELFYGQN